MTSYSLLDNRNGLVQWDYQVARNWEVTWENVVSRLAFFKIAVYDYNLDNKVTEDYLIGEVFIFIL